MYTNPDLFPPLRIEDAGTVPYRVMWDHQLELFNALVQQKVEKRPVEAEHLIFVEHPPVYTLGRHGKPSNMLMDRELLAAKGIECIPIERGGDITFHGPGQLVVYPIIDLEAHHLGVKEYVDLLEEAVIRLIAAYDIRGERVEGATGVWIERNRKICAIGIRCSHFITMHGIGLNVNTDLSYFRAINPCGFTDKGVTSIAAETGFAIPMSAVKAKFEELFTQLLEEAYAKKAAHD
jgi:lipoyl(octanoyl) transferase